MKAEDVGDREKETVLHNRVFDESTLRICMEAVGFINIAAVDNHEAIRTLEVYVGGSRRQMTKHEWSEPDWR